MYLMFWRLYWIYIKAYILRLRFSFLHSKTISCRNSAIGQCRTWTHIDTPFYHWRSRLWTNTHITLVFYEAYNLTLVKETLITIYLIVWQYHNKFRYYFQSMVPWCSHRYFWSGSSSGDNWIEHMAIRLKYHVR